MSCVTSGIFLNLSEPSMPLWKINKIISVRGLSAIAIIVSDGGLASWPVTCWWHWVDSELDSDRLSLRWPEQSREGCCWLGAWAEVGSLPTKGRLILTLCRGPGEREWGLLGFGASEHWGDLGHIHCAGSSPQLGLRTSVQPWSHCPGVYGRSGRQAGSQGTWG